MALRLRALTVADRAFFVGRVVELGDIRIAQSAIVETDVIQAPIEPVCHMESTPASGDWHARLGRY